MNSIEQDNRKTILVVDDEEDLRLPLQDTLIDAGYETDATASGHEANKLIQNKIYDLVILDIELADIAPQVNGFDLCRQWKQQGITSKVLMLTGKYQSDIATVHGFEQGADEYVVKPYSLAVLLARIKRLLKSSSPTDLDSYSIQGLCINRISREVSDGQNEQYVLTPKEYKLLLFLVDNKGRSISYDEILQTVWGKNIVVNQATINNTVHNIRKKLAVKSSSSYNIVNVHSFGFKYIETQ